MPIHVLYNMPVDMEITQSHLKEYTHGPFWYHCIPLSHIFKILRVYLYIFSREDVAMKKELMIQMTTSSALEFIRVILTHF